MYAMMNRIPARTARCQQVMTRVMQWTVQELSCVLRKPCCHHRINMNEWVYTVYQPWLFTNHYLYCADVSMYSGGQASHA